VRGAGEGAEGHGFIVGVQQPVGLGTAGFHAFREARPVKPWSCISASSCRAITRLIARGDLFMEAVLFQEIVERRSDPCFFFVT
jgi:hypothetical protein